MADPRFFQNSGSTTLAQLADIGGASLADGTDGNLSINDVAPLDRAGANDLSFLDNIKYKEQFKGTKAGACVVAPEMQKFAPAGLALIISSNPYKSYALIAQHFYPDQAKSNGSIHPSAIIHETAEIGENCSIDACAVIGAGVKIGNNCVIGANASLSHCILGDNVRLYPGARIGQDGFGFAIDPAGFVKVPQLGRVIIEDSVEIGANTTIDRGAGPDTVIGQGTWIDNLVQIGHNVKIGKGCVIVSQAGISGSTIIDDFVMIGGQAGIAGHLHVGSGAKVAAQSGIMRNIPAGEEQMGYPALPMKQFMRQIATLNRLSKKK